MDKPDIHRFLGAINYLGEFWRLQWYFKWIPLTMVWSQFHYNPPKFSLITPS